MNSFTDVYPVDAPILFRLSFEPFVAYLNTQRTKSLSIALYDLYSYLIDQFTPILTLDDPTSQLDPARLTELFQLATVAVLPLGSSNQDIPFAFGLPVPMTIFYKSAAFSHLTQQFPGLMAKLPEQTSIEDRQRLLYRHILEKCYGVHFDGQACPSFRFQQELNGLTQYYRMDIDLSFVEPHPHNDQALPPLQQAWIGFVNDTQMLPPDVDQLPVDDFTFNGFCFFRIEDETETETLHQLQDIFVHLQSDTEALVYRRIEKALRNLCGQPDLQIGLMPLPQVNGYFVYHPDLKQRSVFLKYSGINIHNYKDPVAQQMARDLMSHPTPHLFPGLAGVPEAEKKALSQQGIRSFMIYPIATATEVLGILEMSSPHADAFDKTVMGKIERILPLLEELLRYQLQQFEQSLEEIVKANFTSLQPAVEWKFYEAGWENLRLGTTERNRTGAASVRFPQVYPLYGAVDVRDSSVERQTALRHDLTDQLSAVARLLHKPPSPLLTKFQHWQSRLSVELKPEDEEAIDRFLTQDIHPYLRQQLNDQDGVAAQIDRYFTATNPVTGRFSRMMSRYEQSMDWINAAVNDYIDQEESKLQAVYPHYAERYRTDGTEFTLYVGQSIAPSTPFLPTIHQTFCSWQLTTMVEMAQLTHQLLPALPLPLRTTQLILVHAQPVDISFRQDERRFDVEGSYSIRYEVLKKRIDKAHVHHTQERLTQPDTIAIVYRQQSELSDYLTVIDHLQKTGRLQPGIDYFDLEPMQGISNLKALRLQLIYTG